MRALVVGGTRFFGRHLVAELLGQGQEVTLCNRGVTPDAFGSSVNRIHAERTDPHALKAALSGRRFDVVYDNLAYCSNDVKYLLEAVDTERYVMASTCSVYTELHENTQEQEFDPLAKELVWCGREPFVYDEIKRQAECALYQAFAQVPAVAVRYPFVVGTDDYTDRLYFYVQHTVQQKPMHVDNPNAEMAFISSGEAGRFLAWLGGRNITGAYNGASAGAISMGQVIGYVEKQTGARAVISPGGAPAPYNGVPGYTIGTTRAAQLGFQFSPLEEWIYPLLDSYIKRAKTA